MPLSTIELAACLKRAGDLAIDLAREITREHGERSTTARAMMEAIKQDVDVVHEALNEPAY
jgi:hypothetical protein